MHLTKAQRHYRRIDIQYAAKGGGHKIDPALVLGAHQHNRHGIQVTGVHYLFLGHFSYSFVPIHRLLCTLSGLNLSSLRSFSSGYPMETSATGTI